MSNNYFEIIRPGINTTFQDKGRDNLYHVGIPFSGVMDNRNYLMANKLVNNKLDAAIIEFAYQGPHLKYTGEKINFAITGDVIFTIKKDDIEIEGKCYESYQIESGNEINIISTNKSVYGYLGISGQIDLKYQWSSCSINTKANIGANNGKKFEVNLFNEKNNGESLLSLIEKGYIKSAHDISLGGLLTAVSKMCIKGNKGIKFKKLKQSMNEIEYFFSEDQGRYLIEINPKDLANVSKILDKNSVYHEELGIIIDKELIINEKTKLTIDELRSYNNNWLIKYMS